MKIKTKKIIINSCSSVRGTNIHKESLIGIFNFGQLAKRVDIGNYREKYKCEQRNTISIYV